MRDFEQCACDLVAELVVDCLELANPPECMVNA